MANKPVIDEAQAIIGSVFSKPPSKAYKHVHTWDFIGKELLLPIKTLYDYESFAQKVFRTFKLK